MSIQRTTIVCTNKSGKMVAGVSFIGPDEGRTIEFLRDSMEVSHEIRVYTEDFKTAPTYLVSGGCLGYNNGRGEFINYLAWLPSQKRFVSFPYAIKRKELPIKKLVIEDAKRLCISVAVAKKQRLGSNS